jgi:hypothetical protein
MWLLFIHEVIVECLSHAWGKVLILIFIFGIIRSWAGSVWCNICTTVIDLTPSQIWVISLHMIALNTIVSPWMSGFLEFLIQRWSYYRSLIIPRLLGLLRFLVFHWLFCWFIGLLLHVTVRYIHTSTFQTFSAYLFAWLGLGKRGSVNDLRAISVGSTTADYWSIIVICIGIFVLKGRWSHLVEVRLLPEVIPLSLWHHCFLIKLWRSIGNLDWLSVMGIWSLLELVCIIIVSSRGSSTLLSLMILIFEVWINRYEILFLYNPLFLRIFFRFLPLLPIFRAATPLSLLFWIFACRRLWLLRWANLLITPTPSNQLLMMSLQRHIRVQLVHNLSGTLRATTRGEYHRNIDFTSWGVTIGVGCEGTVASDKLLLFIVLGGKFA